MDYTMLRFLFSILFCLNFLFHKTVSRSIRSKRYVEFSIQCRQNEDFTWDCLCPQRNVIITLSDSDDVFIVCGLDFRLSLLSKTPRYVNQQLATNFDRLAEHERPNKFAGDDDFLSRFREDKILEGVRNSDSNTQNAGQNSRNSDQFRNMDSYPRRVDDDMWDSKWPNERNEIEETNIRSYERGNEDYENNHYRRKYPSGNELKEQRKTDSMFPFHGRGSHFKTTPGGLISEEALDEKLESVLSKSVESKPNSEQSSFETQLDENRENTSGNEHEDEISNRFRSSTYHDQNILRTETSTKSSTDNLGIETSTKATTYMTTTNSVKNNQNIADSDLPSSSSVIDNISTDDAPIQDENDKTVEDLIPNMESKGNVLKTSTHFVTLSTVTLKNSQENKETTTANKIFDIKNQIYDNKITQSIKKESSNEIGCKYSGRALAIGESITINHYCKMVCAGHKTLKTICQSSDKSVVNLKQTDDSTIINKKPEGYNSEQDQGTSNIQTENISTTLGPLNITNNITIRNETDKNPEPNDDSNPDKEDEATKEKCSFGGQTFGIGESVQLNYACRMICLHKDSMRRDCSGVKQIENIRDPSFSFDNWTP